MRQTVVQGAALQIEGTFWVLSGVKTCCTTIKVILRYKEQLVVTVALLTLQTPPADQVAPSIV